MASSIPRTTLPELVAGKLAAAILENQHLPGAYFPSERDLIKDLGVSRASLREGLHILAEAGLIEAHQGVGWLVNELSRPQAAKARKLAAKISPVVSEAPARRKTAKASGPRRLPVAKEKPLHIPNLKKDRLGTFDFISWWEREKVRDARVMVVGAGALGNEVVKNLALMGIGSMYIVDFDKIEAANLSRSILFREKDGGREKAQIAAARAACRWPKRSPCTFPTSKQIDWVPLSSFPGGSARRCATPASWWWGRGLWVTRWSKTWPSWALALCTSWTSTGSKPPI